MRIDKSLSIGNFLVCNKMEHDFTKVKRADASAVAKVKHFVANLLNNLALMFVANKTAKRAALFEKYNALNDLKLRSLDSTEAYRALTQNQVFSFLFSGVSLKEINLYKQGCTQDGCTHDKMLAEQAKRKAENKTFVDKKAAEAYSKLPIPEKVKIFAKNWIPFAGRFIS